jgi:hypothetical protein
MDNRFFIYFRYCRYLVPHVLYLVLNLWHKSPPGGSADTKHNLFPFGMSFCLTICALFVIARHVLLAGIPFVVYTTQSRVVDSGVQTKNKNAQIKTRRALSDAFCVSTSMDKLLSMATCDSHVWRYVFASLKPHNITLKPILVPRCSLLLCSNSLCSTLPKLCR